MVVWPLYAPAPFFRALTRVSAAGPDEPACADPEADAARVRAALGEVADEPRAREAPLTELASVSGRGETADGQAVPLLANISSVAEAGQAVDA